MVKVWTPILATGTFDRPHPLLGTLPRMQTYNRTAGFTLIEILVVVVIIATILSITLLSFGVLGNDRILRTEGQRVAALIELAQDDAVMQGREFALEFMTAGYRFVEYDALTGQWFEIPGDDTLRLRTLAEDLELELYLEDKRVVLDSDSMSLEGNADGLDSVATDNYSPHLLVYSSGDTTPFELHIVRRYDDQLFIVRGDALGGIEFGAEEDD